jgi:FixJ family two-component response regulator
MNPAPLIHVIDDDAAMRTALGRLLTACGYRVQLYESGRAFLDGGSHDAAGCILLDVNMPGLTGLQLQEHLAGSGSILPIVFLTGSGDIAMSVRAIKAGAEDFLSKPIAREALLDAIGRALLRCEAAYAERAELAGLRQRYRSLTAREQEVFALVIQGQLNKQIAAVLGNTERTVKAQRQAVMEKLAAGSVAELVRMGMLLGLPKT